ncbi:unnamed protein product [Prunus armeniaca]
MVKHLVGVNNKKIGGMRNIRGILLKSPVDMLKTCDMLYKEICSRPNSHAKKQRAAEIPHRSSTRIDRNPFVEPRAIKHGTDSASLTLLEARMITAKNVKRSSVRAKSHSNPRKARPKVDKPSSAGMHVYLICLRRTFCQAHLFTSSLLIIYIKLVILTRSRVVFAVEAIWSSSSIASSSTQLDELEKKNVDLTNKLSGEQTRHETKMFEMKKSLGGLKSSLSYDKMLVKFDAYCKAAEQSKSKVVIDAYKQGYLDYKSWVAPYHSIKDKDVELFCPDMLFVQGEQINVMDIEAVEELVADETVTNELVVKDDDFKEGATDVVAVEVVEQ